MLERSSCAVLRNVEKVAVDVLPAQRGELRGSHPRVEGELEQGNLPDHLALAALALLQLGVTAR
jgi:hypothetical protein